MVQDSRKSLTGKSSSSKPLRSPPELEPELEEDSDGAGADWLEEDEPEVPELELLGLGLEVSSGPSGLAEDEGVEWPVYEGISTAALVGAELPDTV